VEEPIDAEAKLASVPDPPGVVATTTLRDI
jgi:hypothetical protein